MTQHKQAEALRAVARALEALADTIEQTPVTTAADDMLDATALRTEFGMGRTAVRNAIARGLPAVRGARGKVLIRRRDLLAWLESRPVRPNQRRAPGDAETWEAAADRAMGLQ